MELDLKRRDNDMKIGLLFSEMKEMMEVLLRYVAAANQSPVLLLIPNSLQSIGRDSVGEDGKTIHSRLHGLIIQSASDIKECANTCDTYSKKRIAVKVLKSGSWDRVLSSFLGRFSKHRERFVLELNIHIGESVNTIRQNTEAILYFFMNFTMSSEQTELAARVRDMGGADAVIANPEKLKTLLSPTSVSNAPEKRPDRVGLGIRGGNLDSDDPRVMQQRMKGQQELKLMQQELLDTPEDAIKKNLEAFDRKFEMQAHQLEEIRKEITHSSNLMIQAVKEGAHNRVRDTVRFLSHSFVYNAIDEEISCLRTYIVFGRKWYVCAF